MKNILGPMISYDMSIRIGDALEKGGDSQFLIAKNYFFVQNFVI